MDDTGDGTDRAAEDAYELWRRGVIPPTVTETLRQSVFEDWSRKAFLAGWVQRGRFLAKNQSRLGDQSRSRSAPEVPESEKSATPNPLPQI